nr:MAG TPA: hypothetical protein [Caudoviricetes sp.]
MKLPFIFYPRQPFSHNNFLKNLFQSKQYEGISKKS